MKSPPYRAQFVAYVLAMMADNIEHVISYWVVFQKFHSPALAGFAVLSHWLPFLLFSVAVGALADRFDPRRIIQCGMLLFIVASAGWGFFFITDTLQMWHAMLLLVIHGCAGVLWQTPNQLLLYDIVGPADLPSAVRLNATARYLGVLVGPAVGGVIMLTLGPSHGIIVNTLFYLPMLLWLFRAPTPRQGRRARGASPVRGLADIVQTIRDIGTQPGADLDDAARRADLLHGRQHLPRPDAGLCPRPRARRSRRVLQRAAGRRRRGRAACGHRAGSVGTAQAHASRQPSCSPSCGACPCSRSRRVGIYSLAIALLFAAGLLRAVVQHHGADAGANERARRHPRPRARPVQHGGLGMRAFSGITVGLVGAAIGIHWSLGLSAAVLLVFLFVLYRRAARSGAAPS